MFKIIPLIMLLFANDASAQRTITVDRADRLILDSLISDRGEKLLLINIWATWCIPCREEFPELVKLEKEFRDKLDVIALSVDYIDELESKVIPFLQSQNVDFPAFIKGFSKDEELINYFDKKWNGALPATFIYDKKGARIKFIEGKRSFESFSSILKSYL
jgi:thiol-disulfide isomerase/thioredoxin